jgi:hypothetical protein
METLALGEPAHSIRSRINSVVTVDFFFPFILFIESNYVLSFFLSSRQEVLLHVLMKLLLPVLVGQILLVAIIVKLERQGIVVLPMVLICVI